MKTMTGKVAVVAVAVACAGSLVLAGKNPPKGDAKKWQPGQGWGHFTQVFDADKDGKVSKAELMAKAPGFDHFDTNKDGTVTADEVKALPASQKSSKLGDFIKKFDANNDNKVTRDEWDAKRAAGFDKADKNHDGAIDQEEYKSGAEALAGD